MVSSLARSSSKDSANSSHLPPTPWDIPERNRTGTLLIASGSDPPATLQTHFLDHSKWTERGGRL